MAATTSAIGITPIVIIALILFMVFRRVMSNSKGRKFSVMAIYLTPLIYIALTVYFVIGLSIIDDIGIAVAIALGVVAGLFLGRRSDLFEKDGQVLYKRSTEVMIIWIVAFAVRIGVEFISNPLLNGSINATNSTSIFTAPAYVSYESSPLVLVVDLLLAFSAGLLFGESYVLHKDYNTRFRKK